jgi:GntR family transcriptional regulator
VTEDGHGRVIEFAHAVYRGDRYRIVSRLSLAKDRGQGRVLAGEWSTAPPGDSSQGMPTDPYFAAPA